jgi:hypothetical protein
MNESSNMVYPDMTPVGRYSAIGNEVLERVAETEFTKEERVVLIRIMEDTIGWEAERTWVGSSVRRVTHDIPLERFQYKTGLSGVQITTALDSLEKRRIIKRDGDTITFNHHLDKWL